MSKEVQHFKLENEPASWKPDSIYYINKGVNEVEIFVTSCTGVPKSVFVGSQTLLNYLLFRRNDDITLEKNGVEVSRVYAPILTEEDISNLTIYINTDVATETIGGFLAGEPITPPEGLTQKQFNDKLFANITLPTISFNVNNTTIEKGSDFVQTINITFNQNDAGAVNAYSLEKDGIEISTTQSTAFSELDIFNTFTLQGFASHDAVAGTISAGTINTPMATITPRYKIFYGSVASIPTTSAQVRALGDNVWDNANQATIQTGTTNRIFIFAIPTVINNSASINAQDTTNNAAYVYPFNSTVNVELPDGTPQEYRLYVLQTDNPFGATANHVGTL